MIKTRYKFTKKLYKDYIIIMKIKKSYHIPDEELDIIGPFKRKGKLIDFLQENHINYLILDNMEIISKREYSDNKYYEMKKKTLIWQIYREFEDVLVRKKIKEN